MKNSTGFALLLLVSTFAINAHAAGGTVWSAHFETGNLSEWSLNSGGGEYDCGLPGVGGYFSVASQDVAHSGSWSDKLSITTPNASGGTSCTQMFRWRESENPAYFASGLYYSFYLYIPQLYTINGKNIFWKLFQFKDKHPCSAGTCTDPFWWLIVRNRTPRTATPMYVNLVWGAQVTIPGPFQGNGVGYKEYAPLVQLDLPVGQWIHFEFYLKQNTVTNGSNNYDGRLTVWQDGIQLFDMVNVETKYPDGVQGQNWSVNLYSDGLVPNPAVIYVDDVEESTTWIPTILWSAGFEGGSLSEWYYPSTGKFGNYGGAEYDEGLPGVGGYFSVASQDVAHSGSWSDKLSITTPNASGGTSCTRMFRWRESENPAYFASGLYYSFYLYIPQLYTINGKNIFWNLFQFKDKHPCSAGTCTDPFWWLIVRNRTPRTATPMYVDLVWGAQVTIPGPFQGNGVGYKEYAPSVQLDLPVGQWIHFEFYLKQNTVTNGSNNYDGRLTVWQDGIQLFDMVNVETKYPDGVQGQNWSVNLYSDGLVPNPSVVYVDDVEESTTWIP